MGELRQVVSPHGDEVPVLFLRSPLEADWDIEWVIYFNSCITTAIKIFSFCCLFVLLQISLTKLC